MMDNKEKSKNADTSAKTDKLEDKDFEGENRYLIKSLDHWKSWDISSKLSVKKQWSVQSVYSGQQLWLQQRLC